MDHKTELIIITISKILSFLSWIFLAVLAVLLSNYNGILE